MSTLSTPDLLRRVPLFEHLSDVQADSLAAALEKRRFKRLESIVEVGHKSNMLYIVLSGKANVVVQANGKEMVLATLGPGGALAK